MTWTDPGRVSGIGLSRSDYESEKYINERADAYHRTTGKYPSKQQVIWILDYEKDANLRLPEKMVHRRSFEYKASVRFMAGELSRLIQISIDEDPIRVIIRFMNDMDDIIAKGETLVVWRYAETMRNAARDILELI